MGTQWKLLCGILVVGLLLFCGESKAYAIEEAPDPEPEKPAAEPDKPKGDTGPDVEPGRPRPRRGEGEAGRDPRRSGRREGDTRRPRRPRMPRLLYMGLSEEQQKILQKFSEAEAKFIQSVQEIMKKLRDLQQAPKKEETEAEPEEPGDRPETEGEEGEEGEESEKDEEAEEETDPKEAFEQGIAEEVKEYIKAEVEMHENMIKALKKLDTLKAKVDFWKKQLQRGSMQRGRRGQRDLPGEGRGRQRGRGTDPRGGGERGISPRRGERPTPPGPEKPEGNTPPPKPDGDEKK